MLYAATGVGCVGIGAIGVVVPGLPTTVFLLIASWCFTRSCPWLEEKLIRNRFFGPFLKHLQPGAVMPRRAKIVSITIMWLAIGTSSTLLISRGLPWIAPLAMIAAGVVGTWFIARQGARENSRRTTPNAD